MLLPHRLNQPPAIVVSPSYVELSPPADSMIGYAATDATEVGLTYYEGLLKRAP